MGAWWNCESTGWTKPIKVKERCSMRLFCLTMIVAIVFVHSALADDPAPPAVRCGYVVHTFCSGCTPNNPGGCGCGYNGSNCDCVDASGDSQNGSLITCSLGDYAYTKDPAGKVIIDGANKTCGSASTCQVVSGDCSGASPCTNGSCNWAQATSYSGRELAEQTATCDPNPR